MRYNIIFQKEYNVVLQYFYKIRGLLGEKRIGTGEKSFPLSKAVENSSQYPHFFHKLKRRHGYVGQLLCRFFHNFHRLYYYYSLKSILDYF